MIDIHTHLLPGVDDGSPNVDHSVMVISRMSAEGIRRIVCTPHLNASRADEAPLALHDDLITALRRRAPSAVALHTGFEIMLDTSAFDLSSARLGLGGSRARLVEFPRRGLPPEATEQLLRVRSQGCVPVVAHPERYAGCTSETIDSWRELGAVIQCDAMALLGAGPMSDFARELLGAGKIDILASDNHGDRRSLATVVAWLNEMNATQQSTLMTTDNPGLLLDDQPLRAVPPVQFQKGVFDRLRELIFGSSRRTPTRTPTA